LRSLLRSRAVGSVFRMRPLPPVRLTLLLALGVGILTGVAVGAPDAAPRLVVVARGLEQPVFATQAPGEPGRIYVVEQGGLVRVVDGKRLRAAPFLDVRGLVVAGGEQGLLGLAFPPDYVRTKVVYVNYSARAGGATTIARFRVSGRRAVPSSQTVILRVAQPYPNHNGGNLMFGPDRKLWVGLGDGGSGGDPEDRAQDPSTLLGKLFRLDVTKARPTPELVGIGLRNPWRYSFDRATGDLWIGDVGQNAYEEVDVVRRGSTGLLNFGWDVFEGKHPFESKPLGPGKLVKPIAEYSHDDGCSITGGYVYRGTKLPALRGRYLFGDYCTGTVWSLPARGGRARAEPVKVESLTSFGESLAGELYLVSASGIVYRLS
jgi:glucose/arabinose dehydrogenase